MSNKATKINENEWHYRGFTIRRNFTSPHGTWHTCSTQQGYAITPGRRSLGSGINGDWSPSIKGAVEDIDSLYDRYEQLSRQGKQLVDEAVRIDANRLSSVKE